jgi:hypothetical protein
MKKSEKDRMKELVEMFSKKEEIFVPKDEKQTSNESVNAELSRLKTLASDSTNEMFKENFQAPLPGVGSASQGKTVNTFIDQMYSNPAVANAPIRQPLVADEAFDLAIKRTLKSGAPVNDMTFYDEVNWHLMSLGFPAKGALDIKNAILKMIEE